MRQNGLVRCMAVFLVMFVTRAEFRCSIAQESLELPASPQPSETLIKVSDTRSDPDLPDNSDEERELKRLQLEKENSLRELKSLADRLSRAWKPGQPKPATPILTGPLNPQSSAEGAPNEVPETSEPVITKEESGATEPTAELPSTNTDEESEQGASDVLKGASDVLVEGPIDRLALATSLYAIDQHPECLKVLEELDLSQAKAEDRSWAGYLKASCHRKLGDLSEAEKVYRDLLKEDETKWISGSAMWWLDHLSSMKTVEAECQTLKSSVKAWKEEVDELTREP